MQKYVRWTKLIALVLSCALLGACSLLPAEEVRRTAPILKTTAKEEFDLSYVSRGDMALTKKISCTYVPIQKANLNFKVAGESIDEIFVKVGDAVQKGELLGQLKLTGVDDSISACRLQIDRLRLEIEHLRQDHELQLERIRLLNAKDEEALEKALKNAEDSYALTLRNKQDSLSIQELKLKTLEKDKLDRQLIAPISGTVTYARSYTDSSVSSLDERAVTIADSTMSLFTANTEYWEYLTVGENVTITVKKTDYEAVIADETALGLPAETRIPGEKAKMYFTLLTPALDLEDNNKGSFVITIASRQDVLMVHEDAISRANGETIVYVRDEDGMKTYKPVTVGLLADEHYEVISGLSEGEEVILG